MLEWEIDPLAAYQENTQALRNSKAMFFDRLRMKDIQLCRKPSCDATKSFPVAEKHYFLFFIHESVRRDFISIFWSKNVYEAH